MISSRYPQVTDELLSAYLDNAVTEDEKALINRAIIDEPAIAWRVETLRYTVNLLNSLPAVVLPRSFALSETQIAHNAGPLPALTQPAARPGVQRRLTPHTATDANGLGQNWGFWQNWRHFWQIGNLFLRNAAAASLALFLILAVGNFFVPKTRNLSNSVSTTRIAIASPTMSGASERTQSQVAKSTPTIAPATLSAVSVAAAPQQSPPLAQPSATEQANTDAVTSASMAEPTVTLNAVESTSAAHTAVVGVAHTAEAAGAGLPGSAMTEDVGANTRQPGPDKTFDTDNFTQPSGAGDVPMAAAAKGMAQAQAPLPESSVSQTVTSTLAITPTATISTMVYGIITGTQAGAAAQATRIEPTIHSTPVPTVMNTVAARSVAGAGGPVNNAGSRLMWLSVAQLASALLTLILGLFWWRSRGAQTRATRHQTLNTK